MTATPWRTYSVLDVAEFSNGKPMEPHVSDTGNYWLITLDSIAIDGNLKSRHKRVTINNRSLAAGDLVSVLSDLAHGNLLGLTASIPAGATYVLNQRMARLRVRDGFDPRFIRLQINAGQQHFKKSGQGTSQRHIYKRDFANLSISVPSLREQRAIANLAQNVDAYITTLERLVAKKQAIKQGMMQQLLTGRTRLPGYTTKWSKAAVADLAIVDPETLASSSNPATLIDYISLEDVSRGELLGHSQIRFRSAPSRARRVIKEYDILFGTVRPNLQSHTLYRGGLKNPIASTGFAVVRAGVQADPRFLFNLLLSDLTRSQVDRIIAGSNYPAVSSGDVRKLAFVVPHIEEQRAIGSALMDADLELSALRARLDKAIDIKTGMMQQLLTGRTRLPVADGAA